MFRPSQTLARKLEETPSGAPTAVAGSDQTPHRADPSLLPSVGRGYLCVRYESRKYWITFVSAKRASCVRFFVAVPELEPGVDVGFAARSLPHRLHLIAASWIGSAQYGQDFMFAAFSS